MILESILVVAFALGLDLVFGDPKSKYHPTAWIGKSVAAFVTKIKSDNAARDKTGGAIIVITITGIIILLLSLLDFGLELIPIYGAVASVIVGAILLKTTIAIKGMEKHALAVLEHVEKNDIKSAREALSMIVKRDTKDLDKNHVLSGVLESVSENIVDGITGPLFYYAFFGLYGAFVYRVVNTIDSMIGYKTEIFKNLGWFGANCDKVLNYIPSRLTGLVMIFAAMIIGNDWKSSYKIMINDGKKTESPNAGYPMAALAGALGTKFEKINHYSLGEGSLEFTKEHVRSAIVLMKVTSILFCAIVTVPIIILLSYLGWWIHA